MKLICLSALVMLFTSSCSSQEKVSEKIFDEIVLCNAIRFNDPKLDQPRFSCGFLLKYQQDTFAVTAKHLLKIIKPEAMTALSFDQVIKSWSMFPLDRKEALVVTQSLLNENKAELLADKSTYTNDWLLFSISANHAKIKPLEARTSPLVAGEKLYVVGWTRHVENGPQRVYEFEYVKTIDHRILLKDVLAPAQFGGLSGAPLVDKDGFVVGLVSNSTVDPVSKTKYFSPCALDGLLSFIDQYKKSH